MAGAMVVILIGVLCLGKALDLERMARRARRSGWDLEDVFTCSHISVLVLVTIL